jgi:flagellar basal-body rod modification protein FlgD
MQTSVLSGSLGAQQFLQLFVAQVQHQDPLEPIANQDFLAQLAQFSSVESLERLNGQFSELLTLQQLSQTTELLGQTVRYGEAGSLEGVIEELRTGTAGTEARVGGDWIPLTDIRSVVASHRHAV